MLAVAVAIGCTNKQGTTEAPVFIVVNIQEQPGFVNVKDNAPVQIATMILTSNLKNPKATDPQGFATTTINSYTVHFRRTDGGTLVPPDKTFGCGITIEADRLGDTSATSRSSPPRTPSSHPSISCFPSTGGSTARRIGTEIQMTFDITFFGSTASGMRVQSSTASGILLFQYQGGTPLSRANRS